MKTLLLASAAAISLAVAAPAFAQTTQPLPATPPVIQPAPDPDAATDEEQSPAEAQAPVVEGSTAPSTQPEASAAVEPPTVAAQASVAGEAQTPQAETNAAPPVQSAQTTPATEAPTTPAETQAAPPTQVAATEEAAETAAAGGATPAFASANAVCQPRTTSVHFGRSNSLSRQNQNAIEYAVDAASVCDIQSITIADSTSNQRRAEAVRATLVRQGVPEDRITIAQSGENTEGAATGQLDVRMQFAGVTTQAELAPTATSGANAAASPNVMVAEATPQAAPVPRAAPAPTPSPAPVAPDDTTPNTPPRAPDAPPPTEPEDDSANT